MLFFLGLVAGDDSGSVRADAVSSSQIWCACFLLSCPGKPLYVCVSPILLLLPVAQGRVGRAKMKLARLPPRSLCVSKLSIDKPCEVSSISTMFRTRTRFGNWKRLSSWKFQPQKLLDRFQHGAGAVSTATRCTRRRVRTWGVRPWRARQEPRHVRGGARPQIDQVHAQR